MADRGTSSFPLKAPIISQPMFNNLVFCSSREIYYFVEEKRVSQRRCRCGVRDRGVNRNGRREGAGRWRTTRAKNHRAWWLVRKRNRGVTISSCPIWTCVGTFEGNMESSCTERCGWWSKRETTDGSWTHKSDGPCSIHFSHCVHV